MGRVSKRCAVLLTLLAGGVLALLVLLPRLLEFPAVRRELARQLSSAAGREVRIQRAAATLWGGPGLALYRLEVDNPPGFPEEPFLSVDRMVVRVRLWPLLQGRVEARSLVVVRPRLRLRVRPDGRWNVARDAPPPAPRALARAAPLSLVTQALSITRVEVRDGSIELWTRASGKWEMVTAFQATDAVLEEVSLVSPVGIRLETRWMGDPKARIVFAGKIGPLLGDLRRAGLRGTLRFQALSLEGLQRWLGPEQRLEGAASGEVTLGGTLGNPTASGKLELQGPALRWPGPPPRVLRASRVTASLEAGDGRYVFRDIVAQAYGGALRGKLTVEPRGKRRVFGTFRVEEMKAASLMQDLVPGTFRITGPLSGEIRMLYRPPWRVKGRLRIAPGRIHGVPWLRELLALFKVEEKVPEKGNVSFDSLEGHYRFQGAVLSTPDLTLRRPDLSLRVQGHYNTSTAILDLRLSAETRERTYALSLRGPAQRPEVGLRAQDLKQMLRQEWEREQQRRRKAGKPPQPWEELLQELLK